MDDEKMDNDKWINKIHQGDVLDVLRQMPDNFVDMSITSPPYYNLRNYGDIEGQIGLEIHPREFINKLVEVFHELKRVLKPTGSFFLNIGDTFFGGNVGVGMPEDWKSLSTLNIEKKYKSDKFDEVIKKRNKLRSNWLQPKQLLMVPYRLASKMQDDGWILRNIIIWCLASNMPIYAKSQGKIWRTSVRELHRVPIEDLFLPSQNGDWIKVKSIIKLEKQECFSIHLRNGMKIKSTKNHRFIMNGKEVFAKDLKVDMILDSVDNLPITNNGKRTYDEGWLIGLFLAEGNYEKQKYNVRFSLNSKEMNFSSKLKDISYNLCSAYHREHIYNNKLNVILSGPAIHGFVKQYIDGSGASKKHLSRYAFNENKEFLRGILNGWLDGDGHYDKKNNRWRVGFTCNRELEEDMRAVTSILGYEFRSRSYFAKYTYKEKKLQKKSIVVDIRKEKIKEKRPSHQIKRITKISSQVYNIEVESPHLFVLPDRTITHNSKGNPMPSSVNDRWNTSYEPVFFFVKNRKYFFDLDSIREPYKTSSVKRYDYPLGHIRTNAVGLKEVTGYHCNKDVDLHPLGKTPNDFFDYEESKFSSKEEESKHRQGFSKDRNEFDQHPLGKTPTDIFPVNTTSFKGSHFAVFPPELLMKPIKACCPQQVCKKCGVPRERIIKNPDFDYSVDTENIKDTHKRNINDEKMQSTAALHRTGNEGVFYMGKTIGWTKCKCNVGFEPGIMLDPFFGSGTAGVVAKELNRRWIGIELNPEYIKMAKNRIGKYTVVHEFDGKTDQSSEELIDEDGYDWSI